MTNLRTIETILNLDTGEQIEVDDLFRDQHTREAEIFQLRTKIEKDLQSNTVELVCIYCKQPVAVRGRSDREQAKHFFFVHPYKSSPCIIKTGERLSEEQVRCIKYNGEKESVLHDNLKRLLGYYVGLDPDTAEVKIDQVYRDRAISDKWRKPDVLAYHKFGKIAFELQLSTTFLSVIVGRTIFYQQSGIFLIWIFPNFSLISDQQKFTQKDVFYNNRLNVYVFDAAAQAISKASSKLMLTCFYREYYLEAEKILSRWNHVAIELNDLVFNSDSNEVYYYDADKAKVALELQIEQIKTERRKAQRQLRIDNAVDDVVSFLKQLHKKDWLKYEENESPFDLINDPAIVQALDQKLKFTGEYVYVVKRLFYERKKPGFLKMLCIHDCILIDTTLLNEGDQSVFQELLEIEDSDEFRLYICLLFRKGYKMTETDHYTLKRIYDTNYFNQTESERTNLERWAYVTLYTNLSTPALSFDLKAIHRYLYGILSLKHRMIIGYKYDSMKQLAHKMLEKYPELGSVFVSAIRHFGYYDELLADDKSKKLKPKMELFETGQAPRQEWEQNQLLFDIFPELMIPHL
jgi:competence CoiA-like predicted nuclease